MCAGTGDWTAVAISKWYGASIRGIGTDALIIEGGLPLHDSRFVIGGDRIVAGTYLLAAASCSGEVIVDGVRDTGAACIDRGAGAYGRFGLLSGTGTYICTISGQRLRAVSVKTGPYPAFPTDLQPFLMAALSPGRWNQYAAGDGI